MPAWSSRESMVKIIRVLAGQRYVADLCRKAGGLSVDTWMAIAINDAHDADHVTGRGMHTSQVVAAARVNRSDRTVRRARAVSVQLGIMVELYRGRELSKDERLELIKRSPRHAQRGIPNVYAMAVIKPRQRARISIPRPGEYARVHPQSYGFGHLPTFSGLSLLTNLLKTLPLASADADKETEPPPAAQHRRRRRPGGTLAHELLAHPRMATMLGDVTAGQIIAQLVPYAKGVWHGLALADALLEEALRRGYVIWAPAHSPFALLKTLLAQVDPISDVYHGVGTTGPASTTTETASPRPEPCGRPECDGHGWITLVVPSSPVRGESTPTGWDHVAAPCPACPPALRGLSQDDDETSDPWADEPAF